MFLCRVSAQTSGRSDTQLAELNELLNDAGAKHESQGTTALDDAALAAEAYSSVNDARALWVSLRIWFEKNEALHEPSRFLGKIGEISEEDGAAHGVVSLVGGGVAGIWFQKSGGRWFISKSAKLESERRTRARKDIHDISLQVKLFRLEQARWPQSLEELVKRPADLKDWPADGYLQDVPSDPWGGAYVLKLPGRDGRDFEVIAYGMDKKPGGEGRDKDLSGTYEREAPEKK
ncbi:MAG: type II secretion system protein GspG [Planctomycetota bacterium]